MALEDAWTALREARWEQARALFDGAVAEQESPEALEGLSWAAWWLDDADAVFDTRERAFAAYRDAGDPASAARMATWLAADQLDFKGAMATASGWLERAQRLLEPVEPCAEHGWLAFHQGYIAIIQGQAPKAEQLAVEAARVGREAAIPDLEMLGLALQGMSMVTRAQVAEGMQRLDEASAIALAGEATIPISGAWTCCFLVSACTRVLDFERAFELCDRIAEFAERYGSRYMMGFCRAEYATIHLWRGDWDDAERALEESLEAFEASRPAMAGGPRVGLAELRRRQGRAAECRQLLEQSGAAPRAQLCRARMALDEGDARLALELSERVCRNIAPERPVDRMPSLELMACAQVALGDLDAAEETRERLDEVAQAVGTAGVAARVRAVDGILAAAHGEHDRARRLLEDAVDGFERCGARFDAACTRIDLAATLSALDRSSDARREATHAHRQLVTIGATIAATRAEPFLEKDGAKPAGSARISKRETEVLALVAKGMTNRAIAAQLHISEHTVHRHVTSILRKLDVPSRTAAVALALSEGLVDAP